MPGQLLSLNIIGEQDQGIITEFRFYPGETRIFKAQIFDTQNNQKWIIPATSTLTLTLSGTPSDLTIANASITIDSVDGSIFYTTLSTTQTTSMISGSATLKIDSPSSVTRYAERDHALKKMAI